MAALRSVFTPIADNAALTHRVSSSTTETGKGQVVVQPCDSGPAAGPIRHTANPTFLKNSTRASGSLATLTSRTIFPLASTTQKLLSSNETSIPAKAVMVFDAPIFAS